MKSGTKPDVYTVKNVAVEMIDPSPSPAMWDLFRMAEDGEEQKHLFQNILIESFAMKSKLKTTFFLKNLGAITSSN